MHCKSLWIKASAKCINVNVYQTQGGQTARPALHSERKINPTDFTVIYELIAFQVNTYTSR